MRSVLRSRAPRGLALASVCTVAFAACTHELVGPDPDDPPASPVLVDLPSLPYPVLSTYRFFVGELDQLEPNTGVLPFAPINTLFTDYAHKNRFVWMPAGAQASYVSDHEQLAFEEGTVLILSLIHI